MQKMFGMVISFLMIMGVLIGCSEETGSTKSNSNAGEDLSEISFGSATVGGFWYTLSGAMSDKMASVFPESSTTIVEGGSVSNLLGLGQGTFHIGFSNGQTVPEALNGKGAFDEPIKNVSTVATLYPNVFHIAVREDSDIYSVEDLKGKVVSPGIKGYSGELALLDILEMSNMSYDDLGGVEYVGTADGADLLRDGHIDAITGMLAAPVSTFQELDTTMGLRFIPLRDEVISSLHEKNEGYLEYTIEPNTYPSQPDPIKTVAGYTVLLANNDLMSEDAVYKLTKMMVENRDEWENISSVMSDFTAEYSVEKNVGNLHPGAKKYYKEIGVLE
ncbi:TAXI family TRAP transporter solute-binding subunit [Virgibacillus salexigens]|uniref:TRAP transporter solute receptor, TAXI family n=1 Tax=Virgibacillus massiliensis TaxID=1462526 RepID=A0A024Q9A3_9BACI|nr:MULTISPECIES: TAXI family TRAP transporter solute-binding subunit [Virgibacillus]MYL40726.1 TAXI family TRAP transporter solute-binding subunit [Virgibacillus massiliensis]CDQ38481.1 TRAP transporter solute receptor, TAXI family [Virgibacillus massiliensis]